jgi:peptidoglycan glycosyltransferase
MRARAERSHRSASVNRQLNRLAVVAVVLLAALIAGTTYWQTWAAAGLNDRQDNAIQRVAQFEIKRGLIYAVGGRPRFAVDKAKTEKGQKLYFRRYPTNGLVAQLVGYSTPGHAQAGLERSENAYLTGSNKDLSTIFNKTLDAFKGATVTGNDLALTIDARAQEAALGGLAGRCGAVAALDPRTGKVLVDASSPTYDPNKIDDPGYLAHLNRPNPNCPGLSPAPLVDRANAGLFTPGSTFKVVTVSAALDSGRFTPDSPFYDPGYCTEYGQKVSNAGNPDQQGPESFGNVTLAQGLQHSINSVFCNVGKQLGAATILDYARKFGFYDLPPIETPRDEVAASGLYDHGRLFSNAAKVDPGRLAFGQERLQVTPLQMAMVAAGIANHGVVMRPYVIDRIVDSNGHTVSRTKPQVYSRAVRPQTAAEVTAMMVSVVQAGTGTSAQISGVQVAGKTGTAETGIAHTNTVWFIAFAPAEAPRVAVAVVVERQQGFGGSIAAPIAKTVMEALLRRR